MRKCRAEIGLSRTCDWAIGPFGISSTSMFIVYDRKSIIKSMWTQSAGFGILNRNQERSRHGAEKEAGRQERRGARPALASRQHAFRDRGDRGRIFPDARL